MNEQYARLITSGADRLEIAKLVLQDKDINELIDKSKLMHQRYMATVEGVPILTRKVFNTPFDRSATVVRLDGNVNNCINRNFESDIVDTKVGYFAGKPIVRSVAGESNFEEILTEWDKEQDAYDKDASLSSMCAITGVGYRLLYSDTEGFAHVKNLDHTKEFIATFGRNKDPEYAIRVYKRSELVGGEIKEVERMELYDDKTVTFYRKSDNDWVEEEVKVHFFGHCPLYQVINNDELQGDYEKVLPAIDAYNRTLSDASDEIETNRLAYLVLRGMGLDERLIEQLKQNNVFELFAEDQSVDYLTKDVNDQMIENHLNRLEQNIYKDAKSVDFSDENFSGTASGISLKYKLQGLENKVSAFERKFESMLRYQYKLLNYFWSEFGHEVDGVNIKAEVGLWRDVDFTFKRNLPEDLLGIAEVQQKLKGVVSDYKRLSYIVDDVDKELELQQQELEDYLTQPLGQLDRMRVDESNVNQE